jgi:sarcosine oxidase subunit alpha
MSAPRPASHRLDPQPGEVIGRSARLAFEWDGRQYAAHPGDTIASALAAAGERVFSRSFKYHRPRGILTADVHDPNCFVEVDGEPNVRGAHLRVGDGMRVRSQNAWPSARHDFKRIVALTAPFTGPGFYYKTFMSPRPLRPFYREVLRRFSPGGRVDAGAGGERFDKRFIFHDVVVAGGGPAGIAAALAAAAAGAHVLLVDEQHELGGHLRWGGPTEQRELERLRADVAAADRIEVLTDAVVFGRYDHNWIGIVERSPSGRARERLLKGRPRVLVAAPGLIERPYVFRGNDLPGVMLATGVRRLINLYAVRPGERAVVFAAEPDGDAVAADLERAGLAVELVNAGSGPALRAAGGRGGVEWVELQGGRRIRADLLVTAVGWTAPTALLNMAGARPRFDAGAARFVTGPPAGPDVLATGGIVGEGSLEELGAHARATGEEAARRALGRDSRPVAVSELGLGARPALFLGPTDGVVDYHEDVLAKDIAAAAAEGYDSIELNKRYTTATMGLDQGKLSAVNAIAALAAATGRSLDEVGTTTWRPPYVPVSLGALAGRRFVPFRVTPMHDWHEAHGARFIRAGDWLRPDSYGDPQAEVAAVRAGVGLIDVSTLGKFDLRGPDVARLLEHVYVNRWAGLAVGGVRYGAMVGEDGVVFDDGVTGRLDAARYLMSSTSSGSERVRRWLEWWLQVERPEWQVTLTNATDLYAAMNLAGPRSREILRRVAADVDLSAESFPYMAVRPGRLAGIDDCFMWRIGFTGELSYELYVPAGHGLRVWEAVMEAGRGADIRPFGVEAQRIMRIEKGHAVVGQDTDALTGPFAAGLGRLVRLDKDDTVGRPELVWQAAHPDELPYQLVALQTVDPSIVPAESCQVIDDDGRIAGRVTSSRRSPTLNRSVALALVTPSLAAAGGIVQVRLSDGRIVDARVLDGHAHVDPEGDRLRD